MVCIEDKKDGGHVMRIDRSIQLHPENTEILKCSKCGAEFACRGLEDFAFAYMHNGVPVYVPKADVLCYNCEDEKKYEAAKENMIGGPLNNVEV